MVKHITTVLLGDDGMWKYWIITNIFPDFSERNLNPLLPVLKKIHSHPSQDDIDCEVHIEIATMLSARGFQI